MKSYLIRSFLVLAGLGISALTAHAHHSGAGFNSDEVIEITGAVKEFQFTNPHTWIQVIVTNEDGTMARIVEAPNVSCVGRSDSSGPIGVSPTRNSGT